MILSRLRDWLNGWRNLARRRNPLLPKSLRTTESLEERFFLGQLSIPAVELPADEPATAEDVTPVSWELPRFDPELVVPDGHEEAARALERVFSDLFTPPVTSDHTAPEVVEAGDSSSRQPDSSDAESDTANPTVTDAAFQSMSDAIDEDPLVAALRSGDSLALSREARNLERQAKRNDRKTQRSESNATDSESSSSPGLMVHESQGSAGSTSNTSSSTNPSGPAAGSTIGATGIGSVTGTGTVPSAIDQVMNDWADLAFDPSRVSGALTTSTTGGVTYVSTSSNSVARGTASRPEVTANLLPLPVDPALDPQLSAAEVQLLLKRASEATPSTDAIIAVVDRQGNILGVQVEAGVAISDLNTLVFAIDGAVSEARTAAFFSSDQGALTSRTIQFISQSTVTQREVESNPSITDPNSTIAGPGFVAPVGIGGHFPPGVTAAPTVDLFDIEHTNRDSADVATGALGRFNSQFAAGKDINGPGSFGQLSGLAPNAQPRGIATLPGGIPLYRDSLADVDKVGDTLIGGIGVFFPGTDGYATFEQGFQPGDKKSMTARINAPKTLEAEFIALAAAGGSRGAGLPIGTIGDAPAVERLDLPFAQINLAGITLQGVGPTAGIEGVKQLKNKFIGVLGTGTDSVKPLLPGQTPYIFSAGQAVPTGWLIEPHDAADGSLTANDVRKIIEQGITEANKTRAAIRAIPTIGQRTKMVFAVTDKTGEILGLYRMPDSTYFSIDVAVAKARNVAYYADSTKLGLHPVDQVKNIPLGTAMTNRTFRFLAEPRYPSGVDGSTPPPFSILNEVNPVTGKPLFNKLTGENIGPAAPASWFQTVGGYDAFHIGTNFRDSSTSPDNQNGVVFFPGSTALYKGNVLVGGLGVSGDGVDQDDGVTSAASTGYTAPSAIRADRFLVRNVRLPYYKFVRNPYG